MKIFRLYEYMMMLSLVVVLNFNTALAANVCSEVFLAPSSVNAYTNPRTRPVSFKLFDEMQTGELIIPGKGHYLNVFAGAVTKQLPGIKIIFHPTLLEQA